MKTEADIAEAYFAKQELVPLTIGGAKWQDPAKAISLHISQMRNSRAGSDVWESSMHHLQTYREALSATGESAMISEHSLDEKVAQMQKKSKTKESLIGTACP